MFLNNLAAFWSALSSHFVMNSCKGQKLGQRKERVSYEEAMNQAFTEIFQNLRVIEEDTKKQREKVYQQQRRGSAPATMLNKTTATEK